MRQRDVVILGGAGIGHSLGAALAVALKDGPRTPEVPHHPRELRDAPRTEGRASRVKDWEFRQAKGRRPR